MGVAGAAIATVAAQKAREVQQQMVVLLEEKSAQ